MAEASDTIGILQQNLLDAGCDKETTGACIDLAKSGQWHKLRVYLAGHRRAMLEQLHVTQRQIDCLDFLVYRIEKDIKQEEQ